MFKKADDAIVAYFTPYCHKNLSLSFLLSSLSVCSWLFSFSFRTINLFDSLSGSWAFVPALVPFSQAIYEVFGFIHHTTTQSP